MLYQESELATMTAKYRKLQAELEDAEDRAESAHATMLMRTRGRSLQHTSSSMSAVRVSRSSSLTLRTPRTVSREEEEELMFSDE